MGEQCKTNLCVNEVTPGSKWCDVCLAARLDAHAAGYDAGDAEIKRLKGINTQLRARVDKLASLK